MRSRFSDTLFRGTAISNRIFLHFDLIVLIKKKPTSIWLMKVINVQMRSRHLMQQRNWSQIRFLSDAAAHSEHELLIRCDI
jgi:hypothetical protein